MSVFYFSPSFSSPPVLGFSHCFCSYFFWLILSLWFPSPLCGCLLCLCLFFHCELSLSSFLICLFAGVFCFTWGSSPLHIDVNTDCWFWTLLGKGGWKVWENRSYGGLEKGHWEVEAVHCLAIHILQTYTSVPGQKSDAFSRRSSEFLNLPRFHSLSPPCLSLYLVAVELRFPLSNFLLSCFLWNMFYLLLLLSNISLMWNTHLEGELFLKRGRSLLITAIRIRAAYEAPMFVHIRPKTRQQELMTLFHWA